MKRAQATTTATSDVIIVMAMILPADGELPDDPAQHHFTTVAMRRRLASNSLPS